MSALQASGCSLAGCSHGDPQDALGRMETHALCVGTTCQPEWRCRRTFPRLDTFRGFAVLCSAFIIAFSLRVPRLEYIVEQLGGRCYIGSLDINNGFWQLALAPECQPEEWFTGPL